MPGILIVAHTPIASSMLGFIEHTYGELPVRVTAVDIPPHEDVRMSEERVMTAATQVKSAAGILVLTDLMGATPANVASRLTKPGLLDCKILVLAGINLPMLMRAISYRGDGLESVAAGIGSVVTLETVGEQEDKAITDLCALINDRFGEGE